jgi:hypothetical protein
LQRKENEPIKTEIDFSHKINNGYGNLLCHLKKGKSLNFLCKFLNILVHNNYEELYWKYIEEKTRNNMFQSASTSVKAEALYGWLELIVDGGQPFQIVEQECFRKNIKHSPICR